MEEFRLQRDPERGARGEEAEGFCEYASTDIHTFLCCVQVQVRIRRKFINCYLGF